ncbi:MAG TPA: hypothetical protein PKB11_09855 [Desulfovibrio sp.]|uniref:hypothetical protein n=1 Tax=Desulfovibrio sp. TaxID=885 RepID=UPI002C0E9945|nr:hypothetical protein [Desulfovibrio sp.]HMM39047.1 hypothetical protein [Desulfovibrio sp.]
MGAALEAVRAYGDFHGLSREDAERLRPGSPFTKIVFRDGVLSVDYEGCYIDVEPFLDEVVRLMPPEGWGKLDCIDQIEWRLTRYTVRGNAWTARTVSGDQAVERTRDTAGV